MKVCRKAGRSSMKMIKVKVKVYEKGDRVLTPEGMATVTEDERLTIKNGEADRAEMAFSEVAIMLDESCSSWSGKVGNMDVTNFIIQEK